MWIYGFVQNKLSWTLHLQSLSLVVCQRLVSVWMIHRKKAEFETVDGRILCTVCHDSFHNKRGISSIGYQVHVLVISYLAPVDQSRLKIIWYRSETNTSTLIIHCQCIEGWFTVASVVAERSISVRTWPDLMTSTLAQVSFALWYWFRFFHLVLRLLVTSNVCTLQGCLSCQSLSITLTRSRDCGWAYARPSLFSRCAWWRHHCHCQDQDLWATQASILVWSCSLQRCSLAWPRSRIAKPMASASSLSGSVGQSRLRVAAIFVKIYSNCSTCMTLVGGMCSPYSQW